MEEPYLIVITRAGETKVYGLWLDPRDAEDYNNGVFGGKGKIVQMTSTNY